MARTKKEKARAIIPLEVPKWYEDENHVSDGFRAAYSHAASQGNTEKASLLFATNHEEDEEFTGGN